MAATRTLMLTEEQERDFERIKLAIQQGNDRSRYLGELVVLLGILTPLDVRSWGRR